MLFRVKGNVRQLEMWGERYCRELNNKREKDSPKTGYFNLPLWGGVWEEEEDPVLFSLARV